ncbi:bifunctional helix-turn-helix transcriptional regulator/GNAT family N-acetyltransferase [Flagellimonas pacifica]|uniref:Transcriptional regulator, MarR family with acetyltransferase activity n=1 Tax=Flagellimonas pacifica TaxID=1247520 RepID=A0A285MGC5_9FLAO|nr:helix-turn-helix domain-containing GNAT family N-acetyltransferase [Allomuricauda parva]SNY94531.1 transcriptional regulator, MarR family with acetyltransferase activity [Allomuricauda parva]
MDYISHFRSFSRIFTQNIGILNNQVLLSPLSLTESRIIYELGGNKSTTAKSLSNELKIDKGYLSRILKGLESENFVTSKTSKTDNRSKKLLLTDKGIDAFEKLNKASQNHIEQLLGTLSHYEQKKLISSLTQAQQILEKNGQSSALDQISIRSNLEVGDMGFVIQSHAELFQEEYNYSILLEEYVAKGMLEIFILKKPNKNKAWICEHNGNRIGYLFLVDRGETAQLRYFFLMPEYRGIGLGKKLMDSFMNYLSSAGFSSCYLWTTNEQLSAQSLYLKYGFLLNEEKSSMVFGKPVTEQKYLWTYN